MSDSEQIRLLTEIRDCQRESLQIQRESLERQRTFAKLYRGVLVVGGFLIGGLLVTLALATVVILSQLPAAR